MMNWSRVLAPALLLSVSVASASEWPQYRGPATDGKSNEKIIAALPETPQPRWKVPTPLGFSSFAVAGHQAYVIVRREVENVPRDVLLALDTETGKERWSVPLGAGKYDGSADAGTPQNSGGDGPRSSPTTDGQRVYVLTADLVLEAFDAAKGQEVWHRDLVKENGAHNISWKNAASPVIDGGMLFVAAGGEGQSLLGIKASDGSVAWKGESDRITHATPVIATILGVRQVIFYTQRGLVAVRPADGKVLWRHPVRFNVSTAASPVVAGDIVYCSAGYSVGATAVRVTKNGDAFSASELWKEPGNKLANHWSTPVERDGFLYGMFQFKEYGDGPLKCVDIRTGREKWSQPGFGPGQVILVGGELIALTDAGQVVVIEASPDKYKEKARFQAVSGKCWSTPAFAEGKLYVRSTVEGAAFDLSQKQASR